MPTSKTTTLSSSRRRLIAYGFLLINTICWGAALIVVKPSLDFTTPFRFLMYRYAIAALLTVWFVIKYWSQIKQKTQALVTITWLELIGVTLTLGMLYIGLDKTSALEASFISTTTPIFLTIAGLLFLHEHQSKREWQGLGLAFIGTLILLVEPWLLSHLSGDSAPGGGESSLFGNLLIIGQNITTIIYFLMAKSRYAGLPKLFVSSISFWIGLISFIFLAWWEVGYSWSVLASSILSDLTHPSVWIASVYMAIFGSIIGLTAYIHGQEGVEASEASIFWYLQPLVYIPLGVFFLREHLTSWQIAALVLIGVGVIWAQKKVTFTRMKKVVF